MKKLYPLLSVLFFLSFMNGQYWVRTYGQGNGVSVDETNDGGFILVSTVGDAEAIHIIRSTSTGDSLWKKTVFNGELATPPLCHLW